MRKPLVLTKSPKPIHKMSDAEWRDFARSLFEQITSKPEPKD
jgi:hypothetical protein